MPQLVARISVADGAEDWAARGPRGLELIARRLPVAEANQPTLVDRLRWVHQAGSQDLAPLAGAAIRQDGVWALYQRLPAVPLPRLLESGPLSPAQVVWVGLGLLGALGTLHRVALGQSVRTNSLLVDAQGGARLDGPWLPIDAAVRPLQIREAGRVLCWALGVGDRPGSSLSGSERQAPALVATLRSLAVSGVPDAPTARALLVDAAGGLAVGAQLERSRTQLASAAQGALAASIGASTWPPAPPGISLPGEVSPGGGGERPAAPGSPPPAPPAAPGPPLTGAAPPAPAPPPAASPPPAGGAPSSPSPPSEPSPQPEEPRGPRAGPIRIGPRMSRESAARARPAPRAAVRGRIGATTLLAAAVIALVLVFAIFGVMRLVQSRESGSPQGSATTAPSARTTAPAAPAALPASAGAVQTVRMTLDQAAACSPGRQCQLRVQVNFTPNAGAQSATWVFRVTDRCSGQTVERPGLTTDKYPVYVYGISTISLPSAKRLQIVAKTTSPAVAGSTPMEVGTGAC